MPFVYVVAGVKGTIAATPYEHAMFVAVDLTLGGRCIRVVCSPDNYVYVDIAILLFLTPLLLFSFYYFYYYNYYCLYQHYYNYDDHIRSFHSAQSPTRPLAEAY